MSFTVIAISKQLKKPKTVRVDVSIRKQALPKVFVVVLSDSCARKLPS